jgi:hypothetical protein
MKNIKFGSKFKCALVPFRLYRHIVSTTSHEIKAAAFDSWNGPASLAGPFQLSNAAAFISCDVVDTMAKAKVKHLSAIPTIDEQSSITSAPQFLKGEVLLGS